jgi:pimeloyl-ACP methyl ester carboxylesterase
VLKLRLYDAVVSLTLSGLLAGCGGAPTRPASAVPTASPPPLTLQPCDIDRLPAWCGTLPVYEDRTARTGRKVNVKVVVLKASGSHPAPDPIFWLAGGPGAAATGDASYALKILGPAHAERDLVLVDQRGTGYSNPLACAQPADLDRARQVKALRDCVANLGSDPGAYTSAWAADDLDDARTALGYDQINLYGESYGATAAQVYLLRHEAHVRTASLVGSTLLDVPMFERYPVTSQNALEKLLARCETDTACRSAYPNLRHELLEVLARSDQGPVTLPLTDPRTGQPVLLTHETLRTGIHSLLAGTETAALLPHLIHLIYSEDWNSVAAFIAPSLSSDPSTTQWRVINLAILCYEEWAKTRPAETTALSRGSYLGYTDVRAITVPEDLCGVLPPPKPAALYGPVTGSSVPVLLVNGEVDPQDPPENVAGARQRYPNGLALIAPGQSHGYTGIACRATIMADFIAQGTVAGLRAECLGQVELPAFVK